MVRAALALLCACVSLPAAAQVAVTLTDNTRDPLGALVAADVVRRIKQAPSMSLAEAPGPGVLEVRLLSLKAPASVDSELQAASLMALMLLHGEKGQLWPSYMGGQHRFCAEPIILRCGATVFEAVKSNVNDLQKLMDAVQQPRR